MTDQIDTNHTQTDLERFIERARIAAAIVTELENFSQAIDYAVDLCGTQDACRLTVSGCEEKLSPNGDKLCKSKQGKIIAAPELSEKEYEALTLKCREHDFTCINEGMRNQLAGVDIGMTYADIGIAETGTLVLNCPGEELRLATMVCEYHVCVLEKSKIVKDSFAAEPQLTEFMSNPSNYTAFITGPSRTADIERVLTIGVHGPLELHILLVEGE